MAAKKPKKPDSYAKQVERYNRIIRDQGSGYFLAKRRLTPCTIAREIEEHLHATSVKVFNHNGEILYSDPMRDWTAQFRALELAVKLWGMMPAEKREVSGPDGGPIEHNVTGSLVIDLEGARDAFGAAKTGD